MKSCILITSHLNDSHKEQVSLELLNSLKDKNLPIIFVGNYPITPEIQEKSDYTLNIKENPRGLRFTVAWYQIPPSVLNMECRLNKSTPDYGFAHLHQTLIGFKFCESMGYDYVYHLNYDMDLSSESFLQFINRGKLGEPLFFRWGREENIATNIYAIKSKEYIAALEPKMYLYQQNASYLDQILSHDWFAETFFKWVMEDYYKEKFKVTTDIKFTGKISHNYGDINSPLGIIRIFSLNKSQYIIWLLNNFQDISTIKLSAGGNEFSPIPTGHPHFFLIEKHKGKYYKGDEFVFNSTPDLFDETWTQPT